MSTVARKGGLLYPMLLIAAIAVLVLSATGIATMMGWMPSALSGSRPEAQAPDPRPAPYAGHSAPGAAPAAVSASRPRPAAPPPCGSCGVVESIHAVELQGQVSVRMDDGTHRTFREAAPPAYAVGQKVRVVAQGIVAAR